MSKHMVTWFPEPASVRSRLVDERDDCGQVASVARAFPTIQERRIRQVKIKKHAAFLGVLAAACSSAPVSYLGVAPPGRDTAYDCAVAQLNIMGYTVEDGNKDTGFARGRKQTSGLGTQLFTGNTHHDVLTTSVFDNPATGETNLRVTVTRIADKDASVGWTANEGPEEGENVLAPSDTGKADAQALLQNCGVSNVSGPPSDGGEFALEGVTARDGVPSHVDRGLAGDR